MTAPIQHPISGEGVGQYQPLVWQIVTDKLGYPSIYETDEDGKPGDLVADVFGEHANLMVSAPDLLAALVAAEGLFAHTFAMGGTIHKQMQAAIVKATAATAARQEQSHEA